MDPVCHFFDTNIWNILIFQIRLSSSITDDVDEDPTGAKALWDRGLLNGASQKADFISNFHVGEICMSLQVQTNISTIIVYCIHDHSYSNVSVDANFSETVYYIDSALQLK